MFTALILAAAAASAPARSIDQRVSLVEARQMLQSQALWGLQSAMPGDALKALTDLDLHLQQDRDRDEKMQRLEGTVAALEQRLEALELMLGDRSLAEGARVRVVQPPAAPLAQIGEPVLRVKPQAKRARGSHAKGQAAASPARTDRVAAAP